MFENVDGVGRRMTTDTGPWVSYTLTYEPLAEVSLKVKKIIFEIRTIVPNMDSTARFFISFDPAG